MRTTLLSASALSFLVFYFALVMCNPCFCLNLSSCQNDSCGIFSPISYPFGLRNRGCGHPDFQIDCISDTPHLRINGVSYRVLNHSDTNITVVNDGVFTDQACGLPDGPVNLSASPFTVASSYLQNLTLLLRCPSNFLQFEVVNCNSSWLYSSDRIQLASLLPLTVGCYSVIQVPIPQIESIYPIGGFELNIERVLRQGFEIEWRIDERFKKCKHCVATKGICGFNASAQFICDYLSKDSAENSDTPNHGVSRAPGRDKSYTGSIIGAAIGIGLLFTVALLLVVVYRKRSSFSKELQLRFAMARSISKVEKFLQDYTHQMPTRYSYSKLKNVTNNFADKLGEGGFGVVYKGKLQSGDLVAVKILDQSRQSESQFINEVATIGTLHHVHLVRLMGYCYEVKKSALVYEYMANGSLEKFIFAGREEERILRRDQLYSIALGTARGIAYLHEECHSRIIHFDIKPHNILLDEEFTPKVADFGLAKLCSRGNDHISMTAARGTPGYAAPEVWSRNLGPVTDKSDVYSFGMLLLEMVGGRNNIELVSRSSQVYFPEWAFKLLEKGELETMLRGRGKAEIGLEGEEKARRMTKVGLWCIQYNSTDRPAMSRVVQMLEGSGDVGNPPMPFNASATAEAALLSSTERSSSAVWIC